MEKKNLKNGQSRKNDNIIINPKKMDKVKYRNSVHEEHYIKKLQDGGDATRINKTAGSQTCILCNQTGKSNYYGCTAARTLTERHESRRQQPKSADRGSIMGRCNEPNGRITNMEERKMLRQKYTFMTRRHYDYRDEREKERRKLEERETSSEQSPSSSVNSSRTEDFASSLLIVESEKRETSDKRPKRKPVIRTIKNNSKVYKAVTFVDNKKKSLLRINIPNNAKKRKPVALSSSKQSDEKIKKKTSPVQYSYSSSPEMSSNDTPPPTEVAKWAPASVNRHTMPYYEAWVNTKLAAVSTHTEQERAQLAKRNLLVNVPTVPRRTKKKVATEYEYIDFMSEKNTGTITVRKSQRSSEFQKS